MARPPELDADERALWEKVTRTVRPLHARPAATATIVVPAPLAARPVPVPRSANGPRRAPPPAPARPTPAKPAPTETLDAGWDRRLASGKTRPDRVIDLHGLTQESARQLLYREVGHAAARGERMLLVITGKGGLPGPSAADLMPGLALPSGPRRGAIRASLPRWLAEQGLTGRIAAVRRAHPRHGGDGAVYLILKR